MSSRARPPSSRYNAAPSDDESDFSDTSTLHRTSAELAQYDHETLEQDREDERMLMRAAGVPPEPERYSDQPRQTTRRKKRRAADDSEKELMYEAKMEEGGSGADSVSDLSEASAEMHREKVEGVLASRKKATWRRVCGYTFIWTFIAALFVAIAFGALRASKGRAPSSPAMQLQWNGSAVFAPTTIVISLDGFRADYLRRDITPTLNKFITEGVSPRYMVPSFPSVTFPNHFTLVTGLYPESHGIVGNEFWDPALDEQFYYTQREHSMQPKWWLAEPVWVTAEHQGVKTAIHMWPGSEAHLGDVEPSFLDKYNGSEELGRKVDRVLGLLDLPGLEAGEPQRPQLIVAYVPNVDAAGHRYGPNSTEINDVIKAEDDMLAKLFDGLRQRNLTGLVNVLVVSDHGMATTSTSRTIQLDDLMNMDDIEHMDGWPHYGIRLKPGVDLEATYQHLASEAAKREGFDVYLRDRNMPERYHFTKSERIAPLWIMPKTGWAIAPRSEFDVAAATATGDEYRPRGIHGYDHQHPLMRAIFVAHGPAFPHQPGSRVDEFQNTNVYNIICDSVGVVPRPNNGTLRLPFRPVGLHSETGHIGGVYEDPPLESWRLPQSTTESTAATVAPTGASAAPTLAANGTNATVDRPVIEDGEQETTIWIDIGDWFNTQWGTFRQWLEDALNKAKGGQVAAEDIEDIPITGDEGTSSPDDVPSIVPNGDVSPTGSSV